MAFSSLQFEFYAVDNRPEILVPDPEQQQIQRSNNRQPRPRLDNQNPDVAGHVLAVVFQQQGFTSVFTIVCKVSIPIFINLKLLVVE